MIIQDPKDQDEKENEDSEGPDDQDESADGSNNSVENEEETNTSYTENIVENLLNPADMGEAEHGEESEDSEDQEEEEKVKQDAVKKKKLTIEITRLDPSKLPKLKPRDEDDPGEGTSGVTTKQGGESLMERRRTQETSHKVSYYVV